MEIIRGRLSAADFSNPSQRYNEDTDTFQYTPDNGANWYNSPEADPRHSSIFRLPPLTTSDPRCDAAANMVKWIKDFIDEVIDQLNADATALALTNNFLTRLTTLFPPALLLLLLQEAATSLFDTGATALAAAFTSTQYDILLCAFYCNIENDGTVTAADLTDVEVQIASSMDSVAAAIVDEILFIQGEVGLSNAGVIGGETGDCSDCTCSWHYRWNFLVTDGDFVAFTAAGDPGGTWVSGVGWQATSLGHGSATCSVVWANAQATAPFDIPTGTTVTELSIAGGGAAVEHTELWIGANRTEGLGRPLHIYQSNFPGDHTGTIDGPLSGQLVGFSMGCCDNLGQTTQIDILGFGEMPAFTGGEIV